MFVKELNFWYLVGGGGQIIGIVLYGLANEKHLGNVDYELLKRGCKIVYLDHSGKDFMRVDFGNSNCLVVPLIMDYFKHIDFIKYIYSTVSTYTRNSEQVFFVQAHSYAGILEAVMEDKVEYVASVYRDNIDYVFETSKKMLHAKEALLKSLSEEYRPILFLSGYAAFDVEKEVLVTKRDSIVVALHDEIEVLEIGLAITKALKSGKKIVLRYRYEWLGDQIENYLSVWKGYDNFSINYNNESLEDILSASFTLITSASSTAYTYPIKHLCPAILYFKNKSLFDRKLGGESFFDEKIHIMASNNEEILQGIHKAKSELYGEQILQYRNKEVINYKNASSVIAMKILEVIQGMEK